MRKILIVAALLAAAPFSASAEALSYTYVEGGWTQLQLDHGGGSKPRLDGGYIRGSVAIAEQVHVFGGYTAVTKTWGLVGEISGYRDVTQYSAGVRASF